MPIETLTGFALASWLLLMIPGPTVMLVVSQALSGGRRTALATVPGVALGDLTSMSVSMAGAGAVLATSATLFTVLKLAGAAYLVWLGIGMLRRPPEPPETAAAAGGRAGAGTLRAMFWRSWLVTALNPKSIVFFVAFVPQFIDPARSLLPQATVLIAIFCALAALNTTLWALAAGTLRAQIRRPQVLCWLNRVGGSCLVGAGLLTALARRGTA